MKLDLDPRKAGPKASNTFEISKRNASHCIDGGHGFSGKVMLFRVQSADYENPPRLWQRFSYRRLHQKIVSLLPCRTTKAQLVARRSKMILFQIVSNGSPQADVSEVPS